VDPADTVLPRIERPADVEGVENRLAGDEVLPHIQREEVPEQEVPYEHHQYN